MPLVFAVPNKTDAVTSNDRSVNEPVKHSTTILCQTFRSARYNTHKKQSFLFRTAYSRNI